MNEKLRTFFAACEDAAKRLVNGANYDVSFNGTTSVRPAVLKAIVFERFNEMSKVTTKATAPHVK